MKAAPENTAAAATTHAARVSYGKLLAYLAARGYPFAAAEDALGDAFAAAVEHWPAAGVPRSPEAWLLTVARRRLVDDSRRQSRYEALDEAMLRATRLAESSVLPDERLQMLFACAHPAIDGSVRAALLLRAVLRVETEAIARAFLISTAAMARRLSRARSRLSGLGIRFRVPEESELAERLHVVLETIYAAYFLARESAVAEPAAQAELHSETLYLADLTAHALPRSAEALGLAALLQFCEARRKAQRNSAGEFIPLLDQDTQLWDREGIERGHRWLHAAATLGEPGPLQMEAAIHAAHCERLRTGVVPWVSIAALYDLLVQAQPTIGAAVSRAVAHGFAAGAIAGLAMLDQFDARAVAVYQPWWVAQATLLTEAGDLGRAHETFTRAIALTLDPAVRAYLGARRDALK